MFWAIEHLAQVRVPCLSEKLWGCVVLLEHLAQAESPILGDRASRSGESSSPQREIMEIRVFYLTRRPSEGLWFWAKGDLAQTRRTRPSENS